MAINEIKSRNPSVDVCGLEVDLSSMESVRKFAREVTQNEDRIDILVNNAGVGHTRQLTLTEDGFETQLAVNHLGHFLLTLHLLPLMRRSADARVINMSTTGQPWPQIFFDNINLLNGAYTDLRAHMQSKLAQMLFTRELAKRVGSDSTVNTYIVNPSMVYTETDGNIVSKAWKKLFSLPVEIGAQTVLYCATDARLQNETGYFYR